MFQYFAIYSLITEKQHDFNGKYNSEAAIQLIIINGEKAIDDENNFVVWKRHLW